MQPWRHFDAMFCTSGDCESFFTTKLFVVQSIQILEGSNTWRSRSKRLSARDSSVEVQNCDLHNMVANRREELNEDSEQSLLLLLSTSLESSVFRCSRMNNTKPQFTRSYLCRFQVEISFNGYP